MSEEIDIWIDRARLDINDRDQIIEDTFKQVKKDFALQGITLETKKLPKTDLVQSLAGILEYLEFLHNPKLPALLYQLDLKEADISHKLTSSKPEATYSVLSESILKRCFEKVMWRRKFQSKK